MAVVAKLRVDHKLYDEFLLKNGVIDNLLLNLHFDLDPLRVWLGPSKPCIHQFDLIQALDPLQAELKKVS